MTVPSETLFPGATPRAASIDPAVLTGIRQASQSTHADFGYLMAQAAQESGFQSDAKASTSSAAGLFQFIDSTWLDMVRQHGAKHGIGQLAAQVTSDAAGHPRVADPIMRERILALRNDPRVSAALAGEFAQSNKVEVERTLGRPARATDLYLAHFLGAGGATEILKSIQQNGTARAAEILPDAAAANRSVFFDGKTGEPRTVAELYRNFTNRIEKDALAYDRLQAPAAVASVAGGDAATHSSAVASGRFDRGRTIAPLATFNAMVLVALKLIGRSSPFAPTPTNATGDLPAVTAVAETKRASSQAV